MTRRSKKGLHKEEIKAKIRMRDWNEKGTCWSLAALSSHWGYEVSAIATALNRPWPEIEAKIAAFLKMEPKAIWPDRYDQDGNPLKDRYVSAKNSKKKVNRNDQFAGAA